MKKFLYLLMLCVAASCAREPDLQTWAENTVKYHQKIIMINIGQGYYPIDFGELTPVLLSDQDSTVIGYTIDHRFKTEKGDVPDSEISKKRYYLDKDLGRVLYMSPNFPELGYFPDDSTGFNAMREDYMK